MSGPAAPDFIRYLAAKKGLDDRSLNRHVWDTLAQTLRDRPESAPLRVLEVGCGIGTMVERLLDRGLLTRAAYTGIDGESRSASGRPPSACTAMRRRARPPWPWSPAGPCSSRPRPWTSG